MSTFDEAMAELETFMADIEAKYQLPPMPTLTVVDFDLDAEYDALVAAGELPPVPPITDDELEALFAEPVPMAMPMGA